jgi:hypothetical protein
MRLTVGIFLVVALVSGCDKEATKMAAGDPPSSQVVDPTRKEFDDESLYPDESVCDGYSVEARHLINGVLRVPQRGPVPEVGSRADFVWRAGGDGFIVVELYRGRDHYPIYPHQTVTVRGTRGTFGYVEDGYGLEWWTGFGSCGFIHLELFGNATKRELIRFADGLVFVDD